MGWGQLGSFPPRPWPLQALTRADVSIVAAVHGNQEQAESSDVEHLVEDLGVQDGADFFLSAWAGRGTSPKRSCSLTLPNQRSHTMGHT